MKALSGQEVREIYLRYFEERGHERMPSDSLVPSNDPTLLFTGAGMNQFKDMFIGKGSLPFRRVTTSQKCLRVPDLEHVGLTPYHHTFFEMLGNFSFGDYFKKECIPWVFGYFTDALGIPRERLLVTIYQDDEEAGEVWRNEVGIPPERIYRFGDKENFWPAEAPSRGPNGPCGPCSEIFFDFEPDRPLPDRDGLSSLPDGRFTEIGNCVFTQFDRREDGSLEPLPQKNIDVGLGLERITAVVQGVPTNFDTDLFVPYIELLVGLCGRRYGKKRADDIRLRRIADHIRAITFCIADGAVPGNEGRGYVVRKILRRACRDGYELGLEDPFLHGLSSVVVEHMGAVYPELVTAQKQVKALVHTEETGFRQIYTQGIERFRSWCGDLGGRKKWRTREVEEHGTLPVPPGSGEVAFELHDTYGFPVDITRQLLLDRGLALDQDAFDREMQVQRERARSSSALAGEVFVEGLVTRLKQRSVAETEFIGYGAIEGRGRVLALSRKDEELDQVAAGEQAEMLVDRTPFYAEAGGQVGDQGEIRVDTGRARVRDCRRREGYSFHRIEMLEGSLRVGQEAELLVSPEHRAETERNHTATHLLHRALKDVLGDHVSQAGSLVAADRLRFDFTHAERLSREQIGEIERIVSREIMRATPVSPREMSLEDARSAGFIAMFGEKYADVVRTVSVGDFSRELCGGTHVANTGNIGFFRIVSESSIAAGVRRIEAVTGFGALAHWQDETRSFDELARLLRSPRSEIPARIDGLQKEIRRLRKELEAAKRSQSSGALADLELEIREKDGVSLLATHVADASQDDLLELCDRLRKKYVCLACLLIGSSGKAVPVVAAVTKDVVGTGRHAGNLVRSVARTLGGGGGGRPEMARGSGTDASKIPEALESAWEALLA